MDDEGVAGAETWFPAIRTSNLPSPSEPLRGGAVPTETLTARDLARPRDPGQKLGDAIRLAPAPRLWPEPGARHAPPSGDVECVTPILQSENDTYDSPADFQPSEAARGLGKPQFVVLTLLVVTVLVTAPSVIAVIVMINSNFDVSSGWQKLTADLSSFVTYARFVVAPILAFTVWRAPREQ